MVHRGDSSDRPAPIRDNADGTAAWDEMWDTFCILALDGGPPHRGTPLRADPESDTESEGYRCVIAEIVRGIGLVSGLRAAPAAPGWIAVECPTAGMARWLADAIGEERVEARATGTTLLVPAGAHYTLTGEIKNVIAAVAKTTHYWREHLPIDVRQALEVQERLGGVRDWYLGWLRRGRA